MSKGKYESMIRCIEVSESMGMKRIHRTVMLLVSLLQFQTPVISSVFHGESNSVAFKWGYGYIATNDKVQQ